MKSDEINPMAELERLFEQRTRTRALIAEQEQKVIVAELHLSQEKTCIEQNKKSLGLTEEKIREMAKKLNV
jgi:hypothetical protein